jgi:hypothetical protein
MALWRMRTTVDDKPGFLALLTASLALRSVNILSVQVHTTEAGAVDEFLIDAPDDLTEADLAEAVARGRGRETWLSRTDIRGLVDEPTRVLGLAARVAADPGELEPALVSMLGDCEVTWRHDLTGGKEGYTADTMVLTDPAGGSLVIRRPAPGFTPAEYARAHAMVRLAWVTAVPAR